MLNLSEPGKFNNKGGGMINLEKVFEKFDDDYGKFEKVENPWIDLRVYETEGG